MSYDELVKRDAVRDINQELLDDMADLQRKGKQHLKRTVIERPAIIKARRALEMSQAEFSRLMGVSTRTLQEWEQGRRSPGGPAQSLIKLAISRPDVLKEVLVGVE